MPTTNCILFFVWHAYESFTKAYFWFCEIVLWPFLKCWKRKRSEKMFDCIISHGFCRSHVLGTAEAFSRKNESFTMEKDIMYNYEFPSSNLMRYYICRYLCIYFVCVRNITNCDVMYKGNGVKILLIFSIEQE